MQQRDSCFLVEFQVTCNIFLLIISASNDIRYMHTPQKTILQGGSNMTGTDCIVRTIQSVPVIFEPPCILLLNTLEIIRRHIQIQFIQICLVLFMKMGTRAVIYVGMLLSYCLCRYIKFPVGVSCWFHSIAPDTILLDIFYMHVRVSAVQESEELVGELVSIQRTAVVVSCCC
jgi:hypothetical protein